MTKINDIIDWFESFAPVANAMDFDNAGLLVGDRDTAVTKVLLTLDITADVIDEAKNLGCELIISHHPVIFNPIKKLSSHSAPYLLASKGISALCMHTNLDLSEIFGVNTCLADAVGLNNLRKSELGECLFIGELEAETDIDSFASMVKSALNCNGLRYTNIKPTIKTVALCSGAGGSEIFGALNEKADILLTGEIKHHEINFANEVGINIVDVGHFKSEDIVINPLISRLSSEFSDIEFTKSKVYTDFVKYLAN